MDQNTQHLEMQTADWITLLFCDFALLIKFDISEMEFATNYQHMSMDWGNEIAEMQ